MSTVLPVGVSTPRPAESGYFRLGTSKSPSGDEISINSRGLLFGGKPVLPAMGEFHYTRVPEAVWRDELLKVKGGGITIISSYVFWIHHEEVQGQWVWSGNHDLRKFVQTCDELGLKVMLRCGPWAHGEVRNGGFPDCVVAHKDWKLRSCDTNFLTATKNLYRAIASQIGGLLWKDGGPIIGVQLDNEYGGSPDYLLALKQLAQEVGIDVPLYTKTGWPALTAPIPAGELIPMFGGYADGFWSRRLKAMDGAYWQNFTFKITRTDTAVGNDTLKVQPAGDTRGTDKYPYFTCEIGGGMPASYHMRIRLDSRDIESVVLCRLGSGCNLLGYYMYHGGQNPEGRLSTLQESTASGYANDLPIKSYDFYAPIGEFGQINPHYYWLRRLHLFLDEYGPSLAEMPATIPNVVKNGSDTTSLRWSVRSDGKSGYVFVNNYQRGQNMPAKMDIQFQLKLKEETVDLPRSPFTIPANQYFILPFNMDLAGVTLIYATAQPICREGRTFYFAEIPGIKAEFHFDPKSVVSGQSSYEARPSRIPAFRVVSRAKDPVQIVLLSERDSLAMTRIPNGGIQFDHQAGASVTKLDAELIRSAGPPRVIPLSSKTQLALAPAENDFTNAAV